MKKLKSLWRYFSTVELILWGASVFFILLSFFLFDRSNYLILAASLIGATSLIFNAKGNPVGQILIILFSVIYAIISFSFAYYGEMITYLGMTAPMAFIALISWLKNPFEGRKAEVTVNKLKGKEIVWMLVLTVAITVAFYFVLAAFHTSNIVPSTLSVTTSFIAVYLTFRRSEYFALAYAANDVVLIVLWVMAVLQDVAYVSVVVCFLIFLINDVYGYVSWRKRYLRQRDEIKTKIEKSV